MAGLKLLGSHNHKENGQKKEKYAVTTSFPSGNLIDEVDARGALSQNEAFQITTDYNQGMEKSMSKCSTS